ncbi:MAG TPA: hypothetical protein VHS58_14315 [Acetobacteraceae bacterium]|jgi:hypothetical protein|nr:hypothetical protein [Acetobacteraceae bacterium]
MSYESWTHSGLHAAVRFTVVADAEPGLLPRLLQPFAKRDLIPDRFDASRSGDRLRVDIVMQALAADLVHLVEGNLRQIVGVQSVSRRQEITGLVQRRAA